MGVPRPTRVIRSLSSRESMSDPPWAALAAGGSGERSTVWGSLPPSGRAMMAAMTTPTPMPNPAGQYRFLPGIEPFSAGAIAMAGHEVVHVTLQAVRPWREGFALIDAHLREAGRPRAALCAIELRSPRPFSFGGFDEFNGAYRKLLESWGLLVDGVNPIARTNVAPVVGAPAEPSLFGFSYTAPSQDPGPPTFVVAGSGDLRGRTAADIVRRGETSPEAMTEKAAYV